MDFVEGEDLQEMLEKAGGPLLEAQVLPWIGQVCDSLAYLHTQTPPIIHRDIKPANLRLAGSPGSLSSGPQSKTDDQESKIFLVDFGIAKLFDPSLSTALGARAVTPGYSPYEQYGQGSTDARSDLYALGATLYTLLTGCVPPESIQRMLRDPLQPAEHLNPNLSPQTIAALHKALQIDPDLRFQTALEFEAAISFQTIALGPQPFTLGHSSSVPPPEFWIMEDKLNQVSLTGTAPLPARTQTLAPSRPRSLRWLVGMSIIGLMVLILVAIGPILHGKKEISSVISTIETLPSPATLVISDKPPTDASAGDTWISPIDGMTLVLIPAGDFLMGSTDSDVEAISDEKPQHTIYLSDFWMDRTEVTNGMYAAFLNAKGNQVEGGVTWLDVEDNAVRIIQQDGEWKAKASYVNHPVTQVSWYGAKSYCKWAGRRLPTEAQWEKAARGIDGRIYPWGNDPPNSSLLNFNANVGDTTPVDAYPAGVSPFGLLDMAGNVWEWVSSAYDSYPYNVREGREDLSAISSRVLRGGSWSSYGKLVRISVRGNYNPFLQYDNFGFRCALPLEW
jgi:formylglycine-generating enzyme required for sulfatase activity